jgi:hypothetical protein
MSAVTFADIQRIIDGSRIEITTVENPFGAGKKWFMRQPTDFLYDYAQAIREAAEAQMRNDPTMKPLADLRPTKEWTQRQNEAIRATDERIAELKKKKVRTPEEDIELGKLEDYRPRMIDPAKYSRLDELIAKHGKTIQEAWLIPRLIEDEAGNALFDMETKEGAALWGALGQETKIHLRLPFWYAIDLVVTAKNLHGGQSSDSSSS